MPEPRPEFHLAIMGGCLSHQHGTPFNSLYHKVLADLLDADPGIKLRIHVVRGFEESMASRLDLIPPNRRIDGVLVNLRSVDLVSTSRLFIRGWKDGCFRTELNPAILSRLRHTTPQPKPPDQDAYGDRTGPMLQDEQRQGRRIGRFRLRNLNLVLGVVLGLDRVMLARELAELDELSRLCGARNLPLFVLGPTPIVYSDWARLILRRGNAALRRRLAAAGGPPFVILDRETDEEGRPLARADGEHMSVAGQRFIGRALYAGGFKEWVEKIVG